jgi:hypothetical protein
MEHLVYDSLNEEVFRQFPELRQPSYAELKVDAKEGPYIVFGTLFNRYLADLAAGTNQESMKRAASFLEKMAVAKDERVPDMLSLEVLPTLLRNQAMIDSYWPLLGTATRHRLRCLPPRFSRKVNLPSFE